MANLSEWRWWQRLQAWWQEYYVDNPTVWLSSLPRPLKPFTPSETPSKEANLHAATEEHVRRLLARRLPELSEAEREAMFAEIHRQVVGSPWTLRTPWQISWVEAWSAVLVWLTCLLLIAIHWYQQWLMIAGRIHPAILYMLTGYFPVLTTIKDWMRSELTVRALVNPAGGLYVGLTRLHGAKIALGVLIHSLFSNLRARLLFTFPFLWLLGSLIKNHLVWGLHFALIVVLCLIVLSLLLSELGILIGVARQGTSMLSRATASFGVTAFKIYMIFILLAVPAIPLGILSSVPTIMEWYTLPHWWISLMPGGLPVTMLLVHHPLWGFPQIAITLLVALWLIPQAVRWVERARLRHEPELTPDEGDW
ncbi:MAG: hypothetical protein ABDI19_07950 [Armatimonadota bacterium]